jgi:dTDP-4-amino-4,6-dideoxygalactose transaminase
MTEEDFEEAHKIKENLAAEIHAIVNVALSGKSSEMDTLIRELLDEEFRFYTRRTK